MNDWKTLLHQSARYLETHVICPKHHVEHTGSTAYLLDFYDALNEVEKGKVHIQHLLDLIVTNPGGGKVFYPGHLNPMNMSQNSIDTGTAVDAIARFAHSRKDAFSKAEHAHIKRVLGEVVETYLTAAVQTKKITNQRLWGLTGLASFAVYTNTKERYRAVAEASIADAFNDMTVDGYFRYYPNPPEYLIQYDGISAFYQSRHSAFIEYALQSFGIDRTPYAARLEQAVCGLLSMYCANGVKDMRLECKRWYWFAPYEVASNAFDIYALAQASVPEASTALHNALLALKQHFIDGYLHSHVGSGATFQCPIFWTAHLAWLIRVEGIATRFAAAESYIPFSFEFRGVEMYTRTTPSERVLINTRFQARNLTTGIFLNGLTARSRWRLLLPTLPHAYLFSVREGINHAWYAIRGGYLAEGLVRLWALGWESLVMLLPRFSLRYGRIEALRYTTTNIEVTVTPATKYGTLDFSSTRTLTIEL